MNFQKLLNRKNPFLELVPMGAPARLQLLLLLLHLLGHLELQTANAFNMEPESLRHFSDPTVNELSWGRDSYFGFSVALQRHHDDGSAWLIVSAPRANSSHYNPLKITEPGVIFKCDVNSSPPDCEELFIDRTGDGASTVDNLPYQDAKGRGWLGATLDAQPTYSQGRQATAVCAPRWINQVFKNDYMSGACYWLNSSLPNAPAHKRLPLIDHKKIVYIDEDDEKKYFYYAYGEAGISLHFPTDATEMIIGAPGVFNWKGSVIRLKDSEDPTTESQMFSTVSTFNPKETDAIDVFGLNGYAVTSGHFFSKDELLYASSAPRAKASYGKLLVFTFPTQEEKELDIRALWQGDQQGESFGASLLSADVNGDGLSDLIVGCPTYFEGTQADIGRIQILLGTEEGTLEPAGIRLGSRSPSAKFGTTLAWLGDLNYDSLEDVAVGAPWENSLQGAVYIYLGSKSGLRRDFAQRLSPQGFPALLNHRGFGMGISRGIDIDGNDYPDLSIGSFLSGHALVVLSRTVASIKGKLIFNPPALQVEATSFELHACIEYNGHNIPEEADVQGSIFLDETHGTPRASFSDNGFALRNFSMTCTKNDTNCLDFTVNVESDRLDPQRPIVVKLEHWLVDAPGQRMSLPMTDPLEPRSNLLALGVVTECEDDGDPTCKTNITVEASFIDFGEDKKFAIGSKNGPVLELTVKNSGEAVFLPNVTVIVPKPFALFIATSHRCNFPHGRNRAVLVCYLANPIKRGNADTVKITIDTSKVEDKVPSELIVTVHAAGEGVEVEPSDNVILQKLQLMASAKLELQSHSRDEQIFYQRIGEYGINATNAESSFTHYYTLVKSGPTPLGRVDLVVAIPVNFTKDINFITLHSPETNFNNQPFTCKVEGSETFARISRKDTGHTVNRTSVFSPIFGWNNEASNNSTLPEKLEFGCSSNKVSCTSIRCQIYSWPSGTHSAKFSIQMDIDYSVLADHMSTEVGATIRSTAFASIRSINVDLAFQGNKNTMASIKTDVLPDSLATQGIPWWIILLAILGSLFLLALLVYGLYKMGFFRRKKREEMAAHRALVVSSETGGDTQ